MKVDHHKMLGLQRNCRIFFSLCFAAILVLAIGATINPYTGTVVSVASAITDPCDSTLKVVKISASVSSTNSPYNAIDNNSATRWTSKGTGSWIKPDLGQKQTVCYLDIAWYKGNGRIYDFSIQVSNDNSGWTTIFNGKSSGKSILFERYNFADVDARWIKVKVNGNQWNNYSEITELKVSGHDVSSPTPVPAPASVPYRAMVLPYISVDVQKNAYSEKLKQYDMVVLRVAAGKTPSQTYLDLVRQLPGQAKGLEFRSIAEIKNYINTGDRDGITFIGYVPEPEHGTPQSEIDNIVQSVKDASSVIHNAGLKFELVPRLQHNLDHAADFAPYVDYYTIMGQSYQDKGITSFKSFISNISSEIKRTNPNIGLIFAEVSTERSPSSGLTLQQTFQQCTTAVVDGELVNGGSVWYNTSTQFEEVKTYLDWYNVKFGR